MNNTRTDIQRLIRQGMDLCTRKNLAIGEPPESGLRCYKVGVDIALLDDVERDLKEYELLKAEVEGQRRKFEATAAALLAETSRRHELEALLVAALGGHK